MHDEQDGKDGGRAGRAVLERGLAGAARAESTLQVALSTSLNSLDPNVTTLGEEYVFNGLVFGGLTRIDANSRWCPTWR